MLKFTELFFTSTLNHLLKDLHFNDDLFILNMMRALGTVYETIKVKYFLQYSVVIMRPSPASVITYFMLCSLSIVFLTLLEISMIKKLFCNEHKQGSQFSAAKKALQFSAISVLNFSSLAGLCKCIGGIYELSISFNTSKTDTPYIITHFIYIIFNVFVSRFKIVYINQR